MTTASRIVELEGAFNFRDLGGYATKDGRTVRWRRLFRADGLHRLSAADLDKLAELGLATVIDLRTEQEVSERGRIEWPTADLAYHHLPMMDVLPDRDEFAQWSEASFVAERYAAMLSDARPALGEVFALLTNPASYPAVFHCAAGKDRTGILSALVLGLLGVPNEAIVADYALSRAAMKRFLVHLRGEYPDASEDLERSAAAIVAAEPDTMAMFLERFERTHGSFAEFAADLGYAEAVDQLRDALLEPEKSKS